MVARYFHTLVFIGLFLHGGVHASPQLLIERKEDEILLPPFLRDYDGGILNVTSDRSADRSHRRATKPGEWLDFGDVLAIPDRMGVYVQMNEGLQWVAGGVFKGKIVGGTWNPQQPAYEMVMDRGWMKVWAKPGPFSGSLRIKTPKATVVTTDGVFWMSASDSKTEIYVLSGTVKVGTVSFEADKYYVWSGEPSQLERTTTKWDFVSFEHRISQTYPNLVKLSHRANEEWLDELSYKKYAELRSQGWRKADRLAPPPRISAKK